MADESEAGSIRILRGKCWLCAGDGCFSCHPVISTTKGTVRIKTNPEIWNGSERIKD